MYKLKGSYSLESKPIIDNLLFILLCFYLIAFLHSFIFVSFQALDFIILNVVYLIPLFVLCMLRAFGKPLSFPSVKLVLIVFFISIVGKIASRAGYVNLFFEYSSVFDVRNNAVGGGWFSYLSIFFYPSCICIFYLRKIYRFSKFIYCLIFGFLIFDMVFLAMRMTPMFVFLFWIIFNVNVLDRLKTAKSCFFMVFLAILLVVIFKETTEMKAYKSEMFDWAIHLNTTISTQVVSINSWVTDIHGFDYFKAYVFLSHYLYHSIGELSGYLLSDEVNFFNITAQISKNATCSVIKCLPDEDYYRAGAYKTMYFDFINDFGLIFGVILLALLLAIFMLSCFKLSRLSLNTFVILVVICLSPILNFVYGGMGLFQLMCIPIITMGSFFVTRRNFGS